MDELDVELEFPRFPKEKQEQIRGLVSYTTMMGLTGKDLISIGGKLDRLKTRNEIMRNRAVLEDMIKEKTLVAVGKDKNMRHRWAYVTAGGRYYFKDADWRNVTITSARTNKTQTVKVPSQYNLGRYTISNNRDLAHVMLCVHHGEILLNF
jgi:hypothetical protein